MKNADCLTKVRVEVRHPMDSYKKVVESREHDLNTISPEGSLEWIIRDLLVKYGTAARITITNEDKP